MSEPIVLSVPAKTPWNPKELKKRTLAAIVRAVNELVARAEGNETAAAQLVGTTQPTIHRWRKEQLPEPQNIVAIAMALKWSTDRVLGAPPRETRDLPAELFEAIRRGRYHGAAIEAASQLDLALDPKGWARVLSTLDHAVATCIELASQSHERPSAKLHALKRPDE